MSETALNHGQGTHLDLTTPAVRASHGYALWGTLWGNRSHGEFGWMAGQRMDVEVR